MGPSSIPSSIGLLIIGVSLVAIAVLSVAESSIISVSKIRVRSMIDRQDPRAMAVKRLLDDHSAMFSALILSGNLFTILATSLGTVLAIRHLGDAGIIVATALLTYLTVVFGELTPKTIAVTHAEKIALALARPLEWFIRIIRPVIWIFSLSVKGLLRLFGLREKPTTPYITEEDIRAMISIGGEEGAIEEDEKKLLHRVFEFGDADVSEAMVPRTEVVAISADATVEDALQLVADKGYSRYPVIRDNVDNIVGILYIKDIMRTMATTSVSGLSVGNFMREAYFIPETKMVTALLDEMQKKNFHIAVIMDEYGGTAGLVTLEDIMEEIVGGLQDEFEAIGAVREVEIIDERTFLVAGQTPLDEVSELIGVTLDSEDYNTIGGFVFGLFGRLPKIGEQVKTPALRFLIVEMEDRKISKIKITKL
jgi:putative hemolysin